MPLTPADVHNVAFSKPPIGKRGYNEDEVDAFLDLVEAELARLIEENDDLREQVSQLEQRLGNAHADLEEARARPQAGMAPMPSATQQMQRPVEPPPPMPQRPMEPPRGMGRAAVSRTTAATGRRPPRPGREGPGPGPGDGRPAHRRGQERGRPHAGRRAQQVRAAAVGRPRQVGRAGQRRALARRDDAQRRADPGRDPGAAVPRQGRPAGAATPSASRPRSSAASAATSGAREEDRRAADVRARVPHPAEDVPGVPAARPGGTRLRGARRTAALRRTVGTPPRGTVSAPTPAADHPTHRGGAGRAAPPGTEETCCSWYSSWS